MVYVALHDFTSFVALLEQPAVSLVNVPDSRLIFVRKYALDLRDPDQVYDNCSLRVEKQFATCLTPLLFLHGTLRAAFSSVQPKVDSSSSIFHHEETAIELLLLARSLYYKAAIASRHFLRETLETQRWTLHLKNR